MRNEILNNAATSDQNHDGKTIPSHLLSASFHNLDVISIRNPLQRQFKILNEAKQK